MKTFTMIGQFVVCVIVGVILALIAERFFRKSLRSEEPVITFPSVVKVKPGRLIKIQVTTNCKVVKWFSASDESDLIASDNGLWAIFCAAKPGVYRVFAYAAVGDVPTDPQRCNVVVEDDLPPVPPQPQPEPENTNRLLQDLKPVYAADNSENKVFHAMALADVFRKMAEASKDKSLINIKDVYEYGKRLSLKTIPDNAIVPVRDVVAEYLNKRIPTDTAQELSADIRGKCQKEFEFVSKTLEVLANGK